MPVWSILLASQYGYLADRHREFSKPRDILAQDIFPPVYRDLTRIIFSAIAESIWGWEMKEVEDFFKRQAEGFRLGKLSELTNYAAFPLPLFTRGAIDVLRSSSDLEKRYVEWHEGLTKLGLAETTVDVVGIRNTSGERAQVEVVWGHKDGAGRTLGWAELVYYLTCYEDGDWRISMVDLVAEMETVHEVA